MSYTTNDKTDKLFWALMILRLVVYFYYAVLNGFQAICEARMIAKKKTVNIRFFVYLSFTLFCLLKVVSICVFFARPEEYLVGTVYYFFYSWSVFFEVVAWAFIGGFWLQLLYTFFITSEIRTHHVKRVLVIAYLLSGLFLLYQIPNTIVCLIQDESTAEAIGFIVFLILFFTQIFTNGYILLKHLREHKKKANFTQYDAMIFKTKVLLVTCILSVVIVIVHDIIFNFVLKERYNNFPVSVFIIGTVEIIQTTVVMLVLANGNYKKYLFFSRVRTELSKESSSKDSGSKKTGNNYDMSSIGKSQNLNMDSKDFSVSKDFNSPSIEMEPSNVQNHNISISIPIDENNEPVENIDITGDNKI